LGCPVGSAGKGIFLGRVYRDGDTNFLACLNGARYGVGSVDFVGYILDFGLVGKGFFVDIYFEIVRYIEIVIDKKDKRRKVEIGVFIREVA
jgi:hypothetical protein